MTEELKGADFEPVPLGAPYDEENAAAAEFVESIDTLEDEIELEAALAEQEQDEDQRLTDEELDRVADTAIAALQDILKYFNVGEITIDEYEGEEGELIFDITGDDLAVLIGRHGKTLDAIQLLVSAITLRTIGFRYPIVVDVEGYKTRRKEKLEQLARSVASKAASQGRPVKMRPMTPAERRVVHIALRDDSRVTTESEGEGAGRHVVVKPL